MKILLEISRRKSKGRVKVRAGFKALTRTCPDCNRIYKTKGRLVLPCDCKLGG
jgi:hypothetical protein